MMEQHTAEMGIHTNKDNVATPFSFHKIYYFYYLSHIEASQQCIKTDDQFLLVLKN